MKNEFAPYDLALAMKELGFDEVGFGDYFTFEDGQIIIDTSHDRDRIITDNPDEKIERIKAPTYSQAFRFFREKGFVNETYIPLFITKRISVNGDTYEEAELACVRKLIEIVNQNKED